MKNTQHFKIKWLLRSLSMAIAGMSVSQTLAAPLALSQVPLFITSNGVPNVLMMMGNANSMDEDATGAAVGSAASTSKSEISRNAMKSIISNNMNILNLGLLAYQQNPAALQYLSASPYDASYDPADYNPSYSGPRNGQTKRFRVPNSSSPGNFIYYNVALPSYSATDPGGNRFCYAASACTDTTHDFKGTAASGCTATEDTSVLDLAHGPWDSYLCWQNKTGTSNTAPPLVFQPAPNNNLLDIPATVAAGIASGYSTPLTIDTILPSTSDVAQGITDFGKLLPSTYVDRAWFNNSSPGMGYLHVPLALLDTTQAAKLNNKLTISQPATDANLPTSPMAPLQNSGLAPLEGTLLTAKNYFLGDTLPSGQGGPVPSPPNSCGKNFLVLLTDGLPSVDKDGVPSPVVATSLAAVATQATNLRTSAATVKTYMVGFALPYGVNPNQLDTIAAAGGTGSAYMANDTATLNTAFTNIFNNISAQTGSAASVAVNSGSLNTGSRVYQAKFNSMYWSGQLLSIALNSSGNLGAIQWDAGQVLNTQDTTGIASTSRKILSYKPSNKAGIAFRWPATPAAPLATELDSAQSTWLNMHPTTFTVDGHGAARLDYLRGSHVNENAGGLNFRPRLTSVLGDIVNSAPNYVGPPSAAYRDPSYASFRLAYQSRTPIVYVGANDGMLHGFNAADGSEALAYVPSRVYPRLSQLTSINYAHRYYVDGSPSTADVYYSSAWHTVLVSGMGAGNKGIFGLDVTDPAAFSEANAANIVNFEFPNKDTASSDRDRVGYISGQIPIVKLNNGVYAAVFGNGYNSDEGKASLMIVNVHTGALIKRIDTNNTDDNGLSNPAVIDTDGNGTADFVYGGDLQGNMWKFDLSASSSASWNLAYRLFNGSSDEAITTTPEVSKSPNGDYLVYFGTGKYLENSDKSSNPDNKFYGVWDHFGGSVSIGQLVKQEVTAIVNEPGGSYREVTNNNVSYSGASPDRGWYLDFPENGERSVTDASLRGGRVIFTTMTPDAGACAYGGSSWLMELDYLTGGMLSYQVLDTNNNGAVNASDRIVAGLKLATISSAPAIVRGIASAGPGGGGAATSKVDEYKYINQSNGSVARVLETASGGASRRSAWRQIPLK
jgi:type IV pilus assembly protein PilY1